MITPHATDSARVEIVPAARVTRLLQAERQLGGDGYLCACALYQIWSDLSLLTEVSHQPLALRRQIRCAMNQSQLHVMSIACGQSTTADAGCYPLLTLRPLRQPDTSCRYHPAELATLLRLCDSMPARARILIVDDKPDTGRTVAALVSALTDRAHSLWFASIGHVRKIAAPGVWTTQFSHSPLVPRPRRPLWQLLLAEDHAAFIATLADAVPDSLPVCTGARIVIHCSALEKRYGTGEAWLPWNAPAMARSRLRRINPRKTPLLVTDSTGVPLLHLRFIGENAYGLAEFARLRHTCARAPSAYAGFLDGYFIAQYFPGLRPLCTTLAHATRPERRRWLLQCRQAIEGISEPPLARIAGQRSRVPIGDMLNRLWQRLQARIGQEPAPALPSWLCALTIPPFGGSIRPIRSSLRYAWGDWHWQGDAQGRLHRFHQDANWGDVSWPELEVAAFLLVHRLPIETLCLLDDEFHSDPLAAAIVAASLPAAACVILSGINREVRQFSAKGKARLREDLILLEQQLTRSREDILAGTRSGAPVKHA